MKFTIGFDVLEKLILRFVSKPPRWHGEVVLKYYDGKISFGQATDKVDLRVMKDTYLTIDTDFQNKIKQTEESEMLTKYGAPNKNLPEEGKLKVSIVEIETPIELEKEKEVKKAVTKEKEIITI